MIKGIDTFKAYFHDYKDQYVLIGGAACDIIFEDAGSGFRATKDFDMVLIAEALTPEFGRRFWKFILDGGYEHLIKSNGSPQFFRFSKPKDLDFPHMIELFSTSDVFLENPDHKCIPIHLGDDIYSLSAILLNKEYYQLLSKGKIIIDDVVILSALNLIPFKAKAWLDLSDRKAQGYRVDERDIKKHKNDVIRLAAIVPGKERCELTEAIKADLDMFITLLAKEPVDPRVIGISGIQFDDIIQVLRKAYI
jgi:hypothetical protein